MSTGQLGKSVRAGLTSAIGLKPGNRRGTIACREKAQTDEAIVLRAGQRKTRMAKAELPEPQSSGCYPPRRRSDG
jgi:hypothetical protein